MNSRKLSDSLEARQQRIGFILDECRKRRINATFDKVNQHYAWFNRWYRNEISTGQLMGRTGVKFRSRVTLTRKLGEVTESVTYLTDATHSNVSRIPTDAGYVGGYVSGTPDIRWTSDDWARFPNARQLRIYQGYGTPPPIADYDEIDVESGAVTPQEAAQLVRARVLGGVQWTGIYAGDSNAAATAAAIQALGDNIWNGHVVLRLADWSLSHADAAAKIGTHIHGMSCVAVQFASPTSNPHTLIPGTSVTLSEANVDLNVVDATWIPSRGWGANITGPAVPPIQAMQAIAVILPSGATKRLMSSDGGATWR